MENFIIATAYAYFACVICFMYVKQTHPIPLGRTIESNELRKINVIGMIVMALVLGYVFGYVLGYFISKVGWIFLAFIILGLDVFLAYLGW